MRCPFCSGVENRVVDSRLSQSGDVTRRRRECESCNRRFTTYERLEQVLPWVVKRDGRREPFDRDKVFRGLKQACVKRPISVESIDELIDSLERALIDFGEKEILASKVGEHVMAALRTLDRVAYVRFASVYRQFRDVDEFVTELSHLLDSPRAESNASGAASLGGASKKGQNGPRSQRLS